MSPGRCAPKPDHCKPLDAPVGREPVAVVPVVQMHARDVPGLVFPADAASFGERAHRCQKPVERVSSVRKGLWSWSSSATTVIGLAPSRCARSCWRSIGPTWTGTRRS
ncbi:hypothetical protein B7767_35545 [Streptomyces sp. 13-12-16]|nr:hypothetical protein B7767_35545 [Streptomyces sp. 13-12-16]